MAAEAACSPVSIIGSHALALQITGDGALHDAAHIAYAVTAVAGQLARQGHHVETAQGFELAAPIGEIWPIIGQTGLAWLLSQHDEVDIGATLAETRWLTVEMDGVSRTQDELKCRNKGDLRDYLSGNFLPNERAAE
jgi:hypothetical protein